MSTTPMHRMSVTRAPFIVAIVSGGAAIAMAVLAMTLLSVGF